MSPPPSQFYFFLRSIRHPKRWTNVLPPAFRPFESPLQRLPPRRHHPSVGCCVEQSSSGHSRPVLRPSCNIQMGAIPAPQRRGPNVAHAIPGAGSLHQAHGEPRRCDLDPWRVYPWRGRAKPLGGRVTAAHLVSCAFLCEICSVLASRYPTYVPGTINLGGRLSPYSREMLHVRWGCIYILRLCRHGVPPCIPPY